MWKWIVLILFLILIAIAVWWMLRRPSAGGAGTSAGGQATVPAEPDAAGTGAPYDQALDAPTPFDGAQQPADGAPAEDRPIGGGEAGYGQRYSDGSTDVTSSGPADIRAESLPSDAPPGRLDRTGQTEATAGYDAGDTTSEEIGRGHGEPTGTWQGTDAARETEHDVPGSAGMGTSSSGGPSEYRDSVTGTQNQADLGPAGSGQLSYAAPGQQADAGGYGTGPDGGSQGAGVDGGYATHTDDDEETSGSGTGLGRHTGEGSFSGVQSDAYNSGTIEQPDLAGGDTPSDDAGLSRGPAMAGGAVAGSDVTAAEAADRTGVDVGSHRPGASDAPDLDDALAATQAERVTDGAGTSGTSAAAEVPSPYGPGSAEPGPDGSGPDGWAVKGNRGSMLFHTEESPSYQESTAEVWFESEDAARAAGFKHWDRKRR